MSIQFRRFGSCTTDLSFDFIFPAFEFAVTPSKSKCVSYWFPKNAASSQNGHSIQTLSRPVANSNALDAYFNLNDVNAKFLDRSANLNDRNTNLNYKFHVLDLFREFESLLRSHGMKILRNWPGKPILHVHTAGKFSLYTLREKKVRLMKLFVPYLGTLGLKGSQKGNIYVQEPKKVQYITKNCSKGPKKVLKMVLKTFRTI